MNSNIDNQANNLINKRRTFSDEQNKVINDTSRETIVSAGAGAGKTSTLIEKIYRMLKNGAKLDNFLVLTFTNAAALKLKQDIKAKLSTDENLKHLTNQVDTASIETFDAFALRFVKRKSPLLGKRADLNLYDPDVNTYEKKETLEEIASKLMDKEDDEIIQNFLMQFSSKASSLLLLTGLYNTYTTLSGFVDIDEFLSRDLKVNLMSLIADEAFRKINEIDDTWLEKTNKAGMDINNVKASRWINDVVNSLGGEEILPVEDKRNFVWEGLNLEQKQQINAILDPFKKLYAKLSLDGYLSAAQQEFENYLNAIISILKKLHEKITMANDKNNKYDFVDIANFLIEILYKYPGELKNLQQRYKYVFIDEYQDTSTLQAEFIDLLMQDNDNIQVMYVGDIKQSIYKFRNAVPENFIRKQKSANCLVLPHNYRSHHDIVKTVNAVFSNIFTSEEKHDFVYRNQHEMLVGNTKMHQSFGVYLLKHASKNAKGDFKRKDYLEEAFVVAEQIKRTMAANPNLKYEDFAILMPSKTHFRKYEDVFRKFNMPLQVLKTIDLNRNYLLKLMANLLSLATLCCKDELSKKEKQNKRNYLQSVLKSELFELTDEAILQIINEESSNVLINLGIKEKLAKLNYLIENHSNKETILEMLKLFDVRNAILKTHDFKEKELSIDKLISYAQACDDLNIIKDKFVDKLYHFAYQSDVIETKVLSDYHGGGVILTNIHQAKGLEYKHLFLTGLEASLKKKSENIRYEHGLDILTSTTLKDDKIEAINAQLYKNYNADLIYDSQLRENLRLLYVALTRAESSLYIVLSQYGFDFKLPSYADYLIDAKIDEIIADENIIIFPRTLKEQESLSDLKTDKLYFPEKLTQLTKVNFNFDQTLASSQKASMSISKLIDAKTRQRLDEGTKIHTLFEHFEQNKENPLVVRFLNASFDGKKVLDAKEVICELGFNDNDTNGIIDMIALYDDVLYIIDYKLSDISKEEYQKQLKTYHNYLKQVYQNKQIQAFLYSINKNKVTEVNLKGE